jgi:hypothetical protein
MPGLGLGLSISARNAITAGSSAPSGIPVATSVVNVNYGSVPNIIGTNANLTYQAQGFLGNFDGWTNFGGGNLGLFFGQLFPNAWSFFATNDSLGLVYYWTNPSTNSALIPTNNWFGTPTENEYIAGPTTLTITAA